MYIYWVIGLQLQQSSGKSRFGKLLCNLTYDLHDVYKLYGCLPIIALHTFFVQEFLWSTQKFNITAFELRGAAYDISGVRVNQYFFSRIWKMRFTSPYIIDYHPHN